MFSKNQVHMHNKGGSPQYIIQVKGFYFTKTITKITKEDFWREANQAYLLRFGKEYGGPNWKYVRSDYPAVTPAFWRVIKSRWASINQRTVNGAYTDSVSAQANKQAASYRAHGVTLDMTQEGFIGWMIMHQGEHDALVAAGEVSSIDRIDDTKGYSTDNIRLISLHQNIEKRIGHACNRDTTKMKVAKKKANHKQYISALKGIVDNLNKIIEGEE